MADLEEVADTFGVRKWEDILVQVREAVSDWPRYAHQAGLSGELVTMVGSDHRVKGHLISL